MIHTVKILFTVSFTLLLALGFQYLIVGVMMLHTMDFSSFTITNWIFETFYIVGSLSFGIIVSHEDNHL